MSWLGKSLANSLIADQHSIDGGDAVSSTAGDLRSDGEADGEPREVADPNQGVKDDLSELTQTLTRQFWGVASFLAPSPPPPPPLPPIASDLPRRSDSAVSNEAAESPRIAGIRSDFAEIGGRFRSGISSLSSNLIPFGGGGGGGEGEEEEEEEEEEVEDEEKEKKEEEEEEEEVEEVSVVGVTDEVMAFVRNIGMHPETWLDFPLFDEFEDTHDFEMSDAQQEHALAVESLDRRLAALKIELCPNHMTEGCFWKIYFILLHSRLNKHDAELLLTPQIAEARAMLFQKLQGKTKTDYEPSSRSLPYRNIDISSVSAGEQVTSPSEINPTKLYPLEGPISEDEIINKPVIKDDLATESVHKDLACNFSEISIHDYDDNDDDEWLHDESGDISGTTFMPFGNEEDVSFSDLEDEDEPRAPSSSKTATCEVNTSASSAFSSNRSDR